MKTKIKAWIATDIDPYWKGEMATLMFLGRKPRIIAGYWRQPCPGSGRWPIPNVLGQRPGEIARVTTTKETT
jgi:hypothetical protein